MAAQSTRRAAAYGLIAAATVFALACIALLQSAPILTSDEAKYLAVGRSLLNGSGPITDLGQLFIVHPPLYPIILAAPGLVGLSPIVWGHLLNAVALAVVLLGGWRLATPFGRLQAALVVLVLAAWTYQLDLARTIRLDAPQAALILSYVLVTGRACRTGSSRHATLGAVILASAFLVKESSLIFLVAPFLGAFATGAPLRSILQAAGLTVLVFVVLAGWWFVWYAQRTGSIFALGLPGAALPIMGAVVTAAGAVSLLIATRPAEGAIGRMMTRLEQAVDRPGRRLRIAVAVAGVWAILFLLAFAGSPLLAGTPLFDARLLARYAVTWRPELALPAVIGLGIVPAIAAVRRDHRLAPPLLMLLVGLPWALFAADLGEPPRNDLAVVALAVVGGVGGWAALVMAGRRARAAAAVRAVIGLVAAVAVLAFLAETGFGPNALRRTVVMVGVATSVGLSAAIVPIAIDRLGSMAWAAATPYRRRHAAPALLTLACVVVVAAQAIHAGAVNTAAAQSTTSRTPLAISEWLRSNVPDGSRVAIGSALQQQIAAGMAGRYRLCPLQPKIAEASTASPLGLALLSDGMSIADPVSVDRHPRRSAFFVFSARQVSQVLTSCRPQYFVYVTGIATAAPSMVDWLERSASFQLGYKQVMADPAHVGTTYTVRIYAVHAETLDLADGRTFVSPLALNDLLDRLGPHASVPAIARGLLARVEMTGDAAEAAAALERLGLAASPVP